MVQEEQITKISIDLLVPNTYQPRKYFSDESIQELAQSIKEYGILNPILVRKKDNLYEIIAGERRYRAAKLIGLKEVPVIIKNIDDKKVAAMALIENLQRENISPIEEAKAYQDIINMSNLKEQELSKIIGKSQPYISNKLRLLKLPQNIQDALINKKISERHARTLISINDPNKQTELLNRVINEKLSVKELESIINEKEITDEEIKTAIDDIMKSLSININEEKKEEKESDNMNNGNFFPNQTNNQMSNNMTLNNMNMQTLNQAPGVPGQVSPAPTPEVPNQPFVYNQPTPETIEPQPPQMTEVNSTPSLEIPNPIPDFSVPSMEQSPVMPTPALPELSPMPEVAVPEVPGIVPPTPESTPMPTIEVATPMPDLSVPQVQSMPEAVPQSTTTPIEPLFDQNITIPPTIESIPQQSNAPTFDIPVEIAPTKDKLSELETYLNTNGINYKKYSNENGHCIMIEV